jgi:hypothetical protein
VEEICHVDVVTKAPGVLLPDSTAAATLKRSWAWDESPMIVVRFASGKSFAVDPIFDGTTWKVARRDGGV